MTKIVTVIGARPQFIKAASVSRALARHDMQEVLVHTGQHYDAEMSDVFFEQMEVPNPTHHLGVGGGPHGEMTGRQLELVEKVLLSERPDWVLVYGDTNSTLAGALAAAKLHIPIAHVEAGLRSFNRRMPEEINRVLTDHVSSLLFAPTEAAVLNLVREGIPRDRALKVGDVMLDASLYYRPKARRPVWFDALGVRADGFVLCTIHRAENTEDFSRLRAIMEGLGASGITTILPLHPRTRVALDRAEASIPNNVHVAPPVGYFEMTWLQMQCAAIATDSGGIQKEAYFHGKPCVVLREETEWIELVELGANILVGSDPHLIAGALQQPPNLVSQTPLYGHGDAAELISEAIRNR